MKFFICYSQSEKRDVELAHYLHKALNSAGHDAFIDSDIEIGEVWDEAIERALNECECRYI